jgi:alpha-galactosidase
MAVKISLIGAGSGAFSLSLIRDICATPRLAGSTVSFMDIDEDRLNGVHALSARLAGEKGMKLALEKTTDRRESLKGADFVINTALSAGHGHLRAGWEIARRHGYRFGQSLHIMHDEAFWVNFHQLRLIESVQRDILEVCPRAWYLLVANPVLAATTLLRRKYPAGRMVGLCHGWMGVLGLAGLLGLEREHLEYEMPGVNHFIWLNRFLYKGKDAYPLLDRWLEEKSGEHFLNCGMSSHEGPKPMDIYRRYGRYAVGDTPTPGGGAWGWWYHADDATEKAWKEDPAGWYQGYFDSVAGTAGQLRAAASDPGVRPSGLVDPGSSGESMLPLIESIACDIPRTEIVNVLNEGALVPGVPEDFEVEVPASCDGRGIRGRKTAPLPRPIVARILSDRVAPVEMELAAFGGGSRKLLLELVMMDPWTRSRPQAEAFLGEILAMPRNAEMARHYR